MKQILVAVDYWEYLLSETPSENGPKGIGSEIRKQEREQSTALLTIFCIVQNQRIIKYEMLFIGMNEMEG